MIKYALLCDGDHPFEGWFSVSSDFEEQQAKSLIQCPFCASRSVRKAIMSPAVAGTKAQAANGGEGDQAAQMRGMMMEAMGRVRAHVEETFDYVGDSFAAEARAIHEGASEERGIYGEASPTQVRDLVKDGVPIAPLPPKPVDKRRLN